jgi:DNA polymerase III delta prime subunit
MPEFGIFTETFRPLTLEELVLPKRIKDIFEKGEELNQNYLFYSSAPGSGKTTLTRILSEKYDTLYLNISDESGVDIIRTKIKNHCTNSSILQGDYRQKVIILDEVEGASDSFFNALRGVIEQFAEDVRFLATTNHINKIPIPIQSRFFTVCFEADSDSEEKEILLGLIKRTAYIAKTVGISFEDKNVLINFVKLNYPDMRKIISKIQAFHDSGKTKLTEEDILKSTYMFTDLFTLCVSKPNPNKNYSEIVEAYKGKVDDVIYSLGTEFPKWLIENNHANSLELMDVVRIVNETSSQRKLVIDEVLNLIDCVFKLQMIFNKKG